MTLRRMLAVSHEASRTGAPIVLADVLGWIVDNTDIELHTVLMRDGPLRSTFERFGPVSVPSSALDEPLELLERGLSARGSRRLAPLITRTRLRPARAIAPDTDLIYLNSLTSLDALPALRNRSAPVVSHIHELQIAVQLWERRRRDDLLRGPDAWIAASGAVRTMLVDEFGLPPERVHLHHACVDVRAISSRRMDTRDLEAKRASLGIPPEAAVVMGSGTIEWRKAPEMFVQLACEVRRRTDRAVHFVWVGGDLAGDDWVRLSQTLRRSGADHVHVTGHVPDPVAWFHVADVFALTSHEDPFPLVCLEHAALGHPVVTFRNGGIHELLEPAGPVAALGVVEHLDVGAMAARIIDLLDAPETALQAGRELAAQVRRAHDVRLAASRLVDQLTSLVEHHEARSRS